MPIERMAQAALIEALKKQLAEANAENASLRESEEKYRTLFESIDEGFSVIEVIFDADGNALDLLHVEANKAYERYTGLKLILETSRKVVQISFDPRMRGQVMTQRLGPGTPFEKGVVL